MERSLTIELEDHHPVAIIRLNGYLAQLEVYKLKKQVDLLMDQGKRYLIFDLSQIFFIDSAGVGAIAQIRSRCLQISGQLIFVQPTNPKVIDALASSSLSTLIKAYPDSNAALSSLRQELGLNTANPQATGQVSLQEEEYMILLMDKIDRIAERLERIESLLAERIIDPNR